MRALPPFLGIYIYQKRNLCYITSRNRILVISNFSILEDKWKEYFGRKWRLYTLSVQYIIYMATHVWPFLLWQEWRQFYLWSTGLFCKQRRGGINDSNCHRHLEPLLRLERARDLAKIFSSISTWNLSFYPIVQSINLSRSQEMKNFCLLETFWFVLLS